jgi:hypothetical protein
MEGRDDEIPVPQMVLSGEHYSGCNIGVEDLLFPLEGTFAPIYFRQWPESNPGGESNSTGGGSSSLDNGWEFR